MVPNRRAGFVDRTAHQQFPVPPQVNGTKSSPRRSPLRSKAKAQSAYLGGPSSFRRRAVWTMSFNGRPGCHEVSAQFQSNFVSGVLWIDRHRRYCATTGVNPSKANRESSVVLNNLLMRARQHNARVDPGANNLLGGS